MRIPCTEVSLLYIQKDYQKGCMSACVYYIHMCLFEHVCLCVFYACEFTKRVILSCISYLNFRGQGQGAMCSWSTLTTLHIFPTIVYRQFISLTTHSITILVVQKFTYTTLTVPLNSLENSRKWCHGYRSFWEANWHNLSQLAVCLWMYFMAYLQTQCLFAWHNGKIKRNQSRPQKNNCRPPQVWFILGSNFQTPEGTTFICTNNSMQV